MARDYDSNPEDDFEPVGAPMKGPNGDGGNGDYRGEIGYGGGSPPSNGGLGTWNPKKDLPQV